MSRITVRISLFIGLFLILGSTVTMAQISVTRLASGAKPTKDGVVYALPRTVIKVEITYKETELLRGPYADYAADYMGITDAVTTSGREYELVDIVVNGSSEPDPDQYYFAEIDEKSSKEDRNILISLNQAGIITGVNGGVAPKPEPAGQPKIMLYGSEGVFSYALNPTKQQKTDTVIRVITVDTASAKKRFFKTTINEKPSEQKAREAAEMVARLKESRMNLLTGYQEVNYDPNTLKYMDQQIQNLRDEYLSLFRGLRMERLITQTFYVVPEKGKQAITVCKFSRENGVAEANDPKGREVSLVFKQNNSTSALASLLPKGLTGKSGVIYYRLPELTLVSSRYQGRLYREVSVPIAQFGALAPLPISKTKVIFDPIGGGILQVMFE